MKVLVVFAIIACFAQSALSFWVPYTEVYHGPLAKLVVNAHGFVEDTPEVAYAKAAHLKLVSGVGYGYYGAENGSEDDGSYKEEGKYDGKYGYASVEPVKKVETEGSYDDGSYKEEGAYDDGSYKGEGAYAPEASWGSAYAGGYDGKYGYASVEPAEYYLATGLYDDGSYKGEGKYDGKYGYASVEPVKKVETEGSYDDGSYKEEGAYDDGSYKGEGAGWAGAYAGGYDGKYGYASVVSDDKYEAAGEYDDGSYKPYLYEKKGY